MGRLNLDEIRDMKINKNKNKNSVADLVRQFSDSGFQAAHLADAVEILRRMKGEKCTIFLAFTANMVASGLRGIFAQLCREKFVDAIITTAGSIDHDVIKCLAPYYKGTFDANDVELHKKGINRLGNIFIPTRHFILFEKWMQKCLSEIYAKQKSISPKALNEFIGSRLDESSFLYWAAKNKIPVFCPGITDGAIGLQMFFFKQNHKDFQVDVTADMKGLAELVLNADKTAGIILGGGISKHHLIGANILRDGLDYAVYVSTAGEYDGSLSGAQTREAKSWGKIQEKGSAANVVGDATILFPIMLAALKGK